MSTGKVYKVNVLFRSSICLQEWDIRYVVVKLFISQICHIIQIQNIFKKIQIPLYIKPINVIDNILSNS